MSARKKTVDVGSKMNFGRMGRGGYSLEEQKPQEDAVEREEIVKIAIDQLEDSPPDWNFYPPLEGEDLMKLVESIVNYGLLHPIVVRQQEQTKRILSGHNRVKAYRHIQKELQELEKTGETLTREDGTPISSADFEQIFAILKKDITDEAAREIIIDANYAQRQLSPKLLSRSIIEKYKLIQIRRKKENVPEYAMRKTRDLVAESFQLSGRHIGRYRKIETLHEVIKERFYDGKISLELCAKFADLKSNVQTLIAQDYIDLFQRYPSRVMDQLKPTLTQKDVIAIAEELLLQAQMCRVSFKEGERSYVVMLQEPDQIQKLVRFLEEEQLWQRPEIPQPEDPKKRKRSSKAKSKTKTKTKTKSKTTASEKGMDSVKQKRTSKAKARTPEALSADEEKMDGEESMLGSEEGKRTSKAKARTPEALAADEEKMDGEESMLGSEEGLLGDEESMIDGGEVTEEEIEFMEKNYKKIDC